MKNFRRKLCLLSVLVQGENRENSEANCNKNDDHLTNCSLLNATNNLLPGNISFISPRQYEFGSNPFLLSI